MEETEYVHISQEWLYWAVTGGITVVFAIMAFWVKKWINEIDSERKDFRKNGGLLTRDWCQKIRDKCIACQHIKELEEWRKEASNDGGLMGRGEHTELCREITKELTNHFTERIKEMFDHHRTWVAQELRLITKEQEVMNKLIKEQMKTESGRWDDHDEMTRAKK